MSMQSLRSSPQAHEVLEQIKEWRQNKKGHQKMPEDLWQKAVAVSKIHGASSVATFLNIGRSGLHRRLSAQDKNYKKDHQAHGFVKLPMPPELRQSSVLEVHLTRADGQSVDIRGSGSSSDWQNLFVGWFKASAEVTL